MNQDPPLPMMGPPPPHMDPAFRNMGPPPPGPHMQHPQN